MTPEAGLEPLLRVGIPVDAPAAYPVYLAPAALSRLGELAAESVRAARAVVVADSNVAALYGEAAVASLEAAGLPARLETFPAGEGSKTRDTWGDLGDRLLAAGIGRDGVVVALGGGVAGDLAGFVAATYMRGVPWIVVPTSLLAMLDSAIGGKTGVDARAGKNAVGAFHHPRLVLVDPELLGTLPAPERRAGLAEGIKTAAIRDEELFAWMEGNASALRAGDQAALEHLVGACMRHKAEVVGADPEEAGVRQVLNFGHTAGHALEVLSSYEMKHGDAVAAGMRLESRLGEAVGVTMEGTADRLAALLDACGFGGLAGGGGDGPGETLDVEALLRAASTDKKARAGALRWVLLERIGAVAPDAEGRWSHALEPESVSGALRAAFPARADVRDSAT